MKAEKYTMVFWVEEINAPVKLIREANNYLITNFGAEFEANRYGNRLIDFKEADIQALRDEWTSPDGTFYTLLTATSGLQLGITSYDSSEEELPHVFTISFPAGLILNSESPFNIQALLKLFKFHIHLLGPMWAAFYDAAQVIHSPFKETRLVVDAKMVPIAIHWLNYFGPTMTETIGRAEILSAPAFKIQEVESRGGIILVLQREPSRYEEVEHVERQQLVEEHLDIEVLHRRYPR